MKWGLPAVRRLASLGVGTLLLVIPIAEASDSNGEFVLRGPASFPPSSSIHLVPLALLDSDTTNVSIFEIQSPSIKVHLFRVQAFGLPGPLAVQAMFEERSWSLRDVTVSLKDGGEHAGFLGLYPNGRATLLPSRGLAMEPRDATTVSTGKGVRDAPGLSTYSVPIVEPNFRIASVGRLAYEGGGALKIHGPDVEIKAAENETSFSTGYSASSPIEADRQWLYLEFSEATILLESGDEPLQIAAQRADDISWDGAATFVPTSGTLRTSDADYLAPADVAPVTLDGRFSGSLTPQPGGGADLALSGDLRSTSLVAQPRPASALPGVGAPLGNLLLGLLLGGAGALAGVVVLRRRSSGAEPVAARLLALAREADAEELWDDALSFVRALRKDAPEDGRLAHWEAVLQKNRGHVDAALAAFDEASILAPDGAAAFEAALLASRMGDADHARAFARRAVEQEPRYAAELAADAGAPDDPFAALREDAGFAALVE